MKTQLKGVSIDSPTPINILATPIEIKPLAAPEAIVNKLHSAIPKAINLGL